MHPLSPCSLESLSHRDSEPVRHSFARLAITTHRSSWFYCFKPIWFRRSPLHFEGTPTSTIHREQNMGFATAEGSKGQCTVDRFSYSMDHLSMYVWTVVSFSVLRPLLSITDSL